jgi:hypothetical protein
VDDPTSAPERANVTDQRQDAGSLLISMERLIRLRSAGAPPRLERPHRRHGS